MSFSENLKNIRREKNLSQEQLAELLNVSRQSVSKWEQDSSYPETEKLIQLAQKLDISLDALLLDRHMGEEAGKEFNQAASTPDRKIFIRAFDGSAVSAFYRFMIQKHPFSTKNEPVCSLSGVDYGSGGFWGTHVTLGYYKTYEDAQRELDEIYQAVQNGETAYQLKYFVNVKMKFSGPKIISGNTQ